MLQTMNKTNYLFGYLFGHVYLLTLGKKNRHPDPHPDLLDHRLGKPKLCSLL
jgi:hypothetical protein